VNYSFEESICAGLAYTGGAAGKWVITDEFSTNFDEIGILVISKVQTFRICTTFLDPAKFSVLVIHLVIHQNSCNFNYLLHTKNLHPLKDNLTFSMKLDTSWSDSSTFTYTTPYILYGLTGVIQVNVIVSH
jgi:hypothetical protein